MSDERGEEEVAMFEDAELVIYTSGDAHAEFEPATEWAQELGVISFSLWARYDDAEIPIWNQSEEGSWLSLDREVYHPDPADPVSDAFIEAVAGMPDEDIGGGWGGIEKDTYDACSDVEQLLVHRLNHALLMQRPPEAFGVVEWCQSRCPEVEL